MTGKFEGVDYFGIEDLLSEEERMIRDTIRDFVSDKVIPLLPEHQRAGSFPMEIIPRMGELGVFGASLEGYGCPGLGDVAYGLISQELERGDGGIRAFVSVQGSLVMFPILSFGSEMQKETWIPRLVTGEKIGCFGLTEPDFGSNPAGMITRAERSDGGWVLNGRKSWITNGSIADVAVVWARTPDGIRGFLVEKGTPGFSTQEVRGKLSLRVSDTSDLIFEDCEIPEEAVGPWTGVLKHALKCLTQARYGIAWGAVGSAMACYDEALEYARTRIQFDKPIGSFQIVQQKLVYMVTEITKGQLLCLQLGRLREQRKDTPQQVSLAKRNCVFHAMEIARMARDILGASGIVDEYQCMRHMVNLESMYTLEGTHDIHTLIIGHHITGIPAYK
jgi:glutaryl-CoA dehydrogenase